MELKLEVDNLPIVEKIDRNRLTAQVQRRRGNTILTSRESKEQPEEISLYDIDQASGKFNQTISGGWRRPVPSFRTSVSKTPQR